MGGIHVWTIFAHFVFFTLLSAYEYIKPSEAPAKLIEALPKAPRSTQEYIREGRDNLAFKFVFLGLRKYHLLFAMACLLIFIQTFNQDNKSDGTLLLQQFACLFLGINFLLDDIYAGLYIQFAQTFAILIPQGIMSIFDISLFFLDHSATPVNNDYPKAILIPMAVVLVSLFAAYLQGRRRLPLTQEYES